MINPTFRCPKVNWLLNRKSTAQISDPYYWVTGVTFLSCYTLINGKQSAYGIWYSFHTTVSCASEYYSTLLRIIFFLLPPHMAFNSKINFPAHTLGLYLIFHSWESRVAKRWKQTHVNFEFPVGSIDEESHLQVCISTEVSWKPNSPICFSG